MNVGDMSVTFKLKKNAKFHDGTPVTAKDVKWSLDRAVTVGGFPTFQMSAGSLTKPEQFVVVDDNTVRVDFAKKDRLTIPDLAVIVPCVVNSELVKKNATEKDPWGLEYTKQQHRRLRRLQGDEMDRRHRSRHGAQRRLGRRPAAEGQAGDLAHGAAGRQPPRAAGARRRRHLLRSAEQGFRRAEERRQAQHRLDAVFQRHPVHRHERARTRRSTISRSGRRSPTPLPYQKIMDAVLFGLAKPMFGAPADAADRGRLAAADTNTTPTSTRPRRCWRKPAIPTASRPRCRSISASPASTSRSACWCRKASAQIGIKTTINKVPGANWRTELNKKVHAALHQRVLGLARLSRILLLSGATTARIRSSTP